MKIDVDGYLSHEWEQHCKQEEEGNEMIDVTKMVSVEITLGELGTVIESLMGYVSYLEERIEDGEKSGFHSANQEQFMRRELNACSSAHEKLDSVWWAESGAEEDL